MKLLLLLLLKMRLSKSTARIITCCTAALACLSLRCFRELAMSVSKDNMAWACPVCWEEGLKDVAKLRGGLVGKRSKPAGSGGGGTAKKAKKKGNGAKSKANKRKRGT